MRISDWSSDVCSSDLKQAKLLPNDGEDIVGVRFGQMELGHTAARTNTQQATAGQSSAGAFNLIGVALPQQPDIDALRRHWRSEEHTSELQSLMRTSYAVFCLKNNTTTSHNTKYHT